MEFVPVLVLTALVKKIVDTVKYASAGDVNGAATQVVAWLAGVLVTVLAANSDFGGAIAVNGATLGTLNIWSQMLVGVNLASAAGVGWDVIKAVDNTNSAIIPNLLARSDVPQVRPGTAAPLTHD